MNKELIIDSRANEVEIALLEDKQLVELNKERRNSNHSVGDIYLGKVKKVMPGLNAAFVDVGYEKDAFLHYLDLGPQLNSLLKFIKMSLNSEDPGNMEQFIIEPDIEKTGKITGVLKTNQSILVQIAKEPISTKGPRISSEISFPGRYLVLVPFSNRISVSQKIKSLDERNRLKRLILSIKPKNFGIIIRTVAEGKNVAELDADLRNLISKWDQLASKLKVSKPPEKVVSELDRTSAILRDLLNKDFNSVIVNDIELAEEIKNYINTISPDKVDIIKVHKSKVPVFEQYGIDKQIKASFGKIVTIKSGVYLIIEHTEAMHVIDVNSGHRLNTDKTQETNALEVNLEAASEIARQLRLRDMGGIIVIDFIDMNEATHRRKLFQKLSEEMQKDNTKHTILPPSKFGLVQITRQRVRPELNVEVLEKCPACEGSGKIKPNILLIDDIENDIRYLGNEQNESFLRLEVNPYIYAYLTKGIINFQIKWFFKYKKWIRLSVASSYHLLEYHFFNRNKELIKI